MNKSLWLKVRANAEEIARYEAAAAREGLTLSHWVRSRLDLAAGDMPSPPPTKGRRPVEASGLSMEEDVAAALPDWARGTAP